MTEPVLWICPGRPVRTCIKCPLAQAHPHGKEHAKRPAQRCPRCIKATHPGLVKGQVKLDVDPTVCPWCNKGWKSVFSRRAHQAHCPHKKSKSSPVAIETFNKQPIVVEE